MINFKTKTLAQLALPTLFIGIALMLSCTKDKVQPMVAPPAQTDCPDTISFAQRILPIFQNQCFSCHANGTLPVLTDHGTIAAETSDIIESIKGDGKQLMPQGGPKLADSTINNFICWTNQGKKNN